MGQAVTVKVRISQYPDVLDRTMGICSRAVPLCGGLNTARHGGLPECLHCVFSLDADLNVSRNMARRHRRNMGLQVARRPAYDMTGDDARAPPSVVGT